MKSKKALIIIGIVAFVTAGSLFKVKAKKMHHKRMKMGVGHEMMDKKDAMQLRNQYKENKRNQKSE